MNTLSDAICNVRNLDLDGANDLTGKITFYPIGRELDSLLSSDDPNLLDIARIAELFSAGIRLCPAQTREYVSVYLQQ